MSDQTYAYPFDPTGTAQTNRISGESQAIAPPNWSDFYFVIPRAAPFFMESMEIIHHPSGRMLHEGVDYLSSHRFHDASLATGKAVFGSITLFDKTLTGVLEMRYQTIGGSWTIDEETILEILSNATYNPRITTWEQVVELPDRFPVIDHEWDLVDMVGASEVVAKLGEIEQAIRDSDDSNFSHHLTDFANPHQVNKTQVGLGSVMNYGIASQTQAQAGSANNVYMTPLRVSNAISSQAITPLNNHIDSRSNPHDVTKSQVGLGNVDDFATANQSQALEGTANNLFMTPVRVRDVVDNVAVAAINLHAERQDNPHGVTKQHLGLGNVQNFAIATLADAVSGTSNALYMTPLMVREAISANASIDVGAHINNYNNPHQVTKTQVGLGQVQNYPIATAQEAQDGLSTTAYMTPALVNSAIDSQVRIDMLEHINSDNNPHNVTREHVGLGNVQNYPMANDSEAIQGTSTNRYLSPATLKAALDSLPISDASAHIARTDNPHSVTKAQVGLEDVLNYAVASQGEAEVGEINTAYMTPLRVSQAIDSLAIVPLNSHVNNSDNPHQVTKAQVGLGNVQDFPITVPQEIDPEDPSTSEWAQANNTYLTPYSGGTLLNLALESTLSPHLENFNNPHQVTKDQVGLGNVDNYTSFNSTDVGDAYSDDDDPALPDNRFITPLGVRELIRNEVNGDGASDAVLTAHLEDTTNPHQVTATQVGAYRMEEVDGFLDDKMDVGATAYDSDRLGGMSLGQVLAASAARLTYPEIRTYDELVDDQTVTRFEGVTYTAIGQIELGLTEDYTGYNDVAPIAFTVTGGDPASASGRAAVDSMKVTVTPSDMNKASATLLTGNGNDIQLMQRIRSVAIDFGDDPPLDPDPNHPLNFRHYYQLWSVNRVERNAIEIIIERINQNTSAFFITNDTTIEELPDDLVALPVVSVATGGGSGGSLSVGGVDVATLDVFTDPSEAAAQPATSEDLFAGFIPASISPADESSWDGPVSMREAAFNTRWLNLEDDMGVSRPYDTGTMDDETESDLYMLLSPRARSSRNGMRLDTDITVQNEISGDPVAVGYCLGYVTGPDGKISTLSVLRTDGGYDGYGLVTVGLNLLENDSVILYSSNDDLSWGDGIVNGERSQSDYTPGTFAEQSFRMRVETTGATTAIDIWDFGSTSDDPEFTLTLDFTTTEYRNGLSLVRSGMWGLVCGRVSANFTVDGLNAPHTERPYCVLSEHQVHYHNGASSQTAPLRSLLSAGAMVYSPYNGKLYQYTRRGELRHLLIAADTIDETTVITP